MTPLVVDPSSYLKPHHPVGHCPPGARASDEESGRRPPGHRRLSPWRDHQSPNREDSTRAPASYDVS